MKYTVDTDSIKDDLAATIKYKLERKVGLELDIRRGEAAQKELKVLEEGLRENMMEYLGLITKE